MKQNLLLIVCIALTIFINAQTTYYVDQQNGNDANNGTSLATPFETFDEAESVVSPGDTIEIVGEYTNPSYNPTYTFVADQDSHLWHSENTIRINELNGSPGNYITIKPYDDNTVIKGDGANIIRITNSSYLIIEGFDIEGEVDRIPIATANALQFVYLIDDGNLQGTATNPAASDIRYRNEDEVNDSDNIVEETDIYTDISNENVVRPSYIDTRGLYVSNSEQLIIRNNTIHHTPGGGLRVSDSKYVDILENEIYRCSAKSYSGTHALVVTRTEPIGISGYSINVLRNKIHHNYNEQFSWAPTKTIITPRIDEGKGISLQRNNTSAWINGSGRILVANNLCYWNGFSGVHSNDGHRIDFINNTCYMNSYTNTITYPETDPNIEQRGNNIGISAQGSDDIKMINNISVIDTDWNAFALAAGGTTNLLVTDNLIFGINGTVSQDSDIVNNPSTNNIVVADPLFVNAGDHLLSTNHDFSLQVGSVSAIGTANTDEAPTDDFFGNLRDASPDLGAIEYIGTNITYVYDGVWTPENPSGISTSDDIINVISGNANNTTDNISAETEAQSLNITAGAKLVINTNGSLSVENFNNEGDLTIRSNSTSYGTLLVNNIVNLGLINYRRFVNPNATTEGNDLISAPLYGETFGDFAQYLSNENVIFQNPNDNSQKLFGPFDKTTGTYLNYDTDTTDASEVLQSGIGYRCGTDASSNNIVVFTGNMEVGTVTIDIVDSGPAFSEWNLIGNPYTANLDFEAFYTLNKNQLKSGAYQAIYGYNATSNKWTIWNQLIIDDPNNTELIVPGQGFYVASKPDSGQIIFTPDMRRTGNSDDFITANSSSNTIDIALAKINMNVGNQDFETDIYFVSNQTQGLDEGYDAAAFNGNSEGLFTHLVQDNLGIELAIQALPYADFNNVVVPLGVKATQGNQVIIGLNNLSSYLPTDTFVYLEDSQTNTWTLLNNEDYSFNTTQDINGIGRFFIHFQAETLSQNNFNRIDISIYNFNNELIVNGLKTYPTTLSIYDIMGRRSLDKIIRNSASSTIDLNALSKGVYIVKVENDMQSTTKKVIIH